MRVCCIILHSLVVNVKITEMVFEICRQNLRFANLYFVEEGECLRNKLALPLVSEAHVCLSYVVFFRGVQTTPPPPLDPRMFEMRLDYHDAKNCLVYHIFKEAECNQLLTNRIFLNLEYDL